MLSLCLFAPATLSLLLIVGTAKATAAGPDPLQPAVALERLTGAANLLPAQLPAVRQATNRYAKALAALNRKQFASAEDASASLTVVEYLYFRSLQQVLSPAQMAIFRQLDLTTRLVERP
jgi:hypothetical protein